MAATLRASGHLHDLTQREREEQPWKYIGYRRFCEFVDSDDDFFILRKFGKLNTRVLLALQDDLSELEGRLETHEQSLSSRSAPNVHNGTFRDDTSDDRRDLISEIDKRLQAYNELVIQHSKLRRRPPVAAKERRSLSNWFHNHDKAIQEDETLYIQHSEDIFAIVPRNKTPLRRVLERSSHFRLFRLWIIK